jgi:hypothetical protein
MQDVVSLYLNALAMYREGQIVLSVDEKTSIQALQRKHTEPSPETKHRPNAVVPF